MTKQFQSTCYYVQHPEHKWWGYFTITPEIGLLQIDCDFGLYGFRWDSPGLEFKEFLVKADRSYVEGKLLSWGYYAENIKTRTQERAHVHRLSNVMKHLWPLFIEQLKAEQAQAVTA
jgi:hypothetical protein